MPTDRSRRVPGTTRGLEQTGVCRRCLPPRRPVLHNEVILVILRALLYSAIRSAGDMQAVGQNIMIILTTVANALNPPTLSQTIGDS